MHIILTKKNVLPKVSKKFFDEVVMKKPHSLYITLLSTYTFLFYKKPRKVKVFFFEILVTKVS